MYIVKHRIIFYIISALITLAALISIWKPGFHLGIDFVGGSIVEVSYPGERPEKTLVEKSVTDAGFSNVLIQSVGTDRYVVRSKDLQESQKVTLLKALSLNDTAPLKEGRSSVVGPVVGNELKQKAYIAISVVLLLIVLFVTFAFRKVSEPVPSWKYGLATILALAHDVIVPAGAFIVFAYYRGGDIDMLFVSALLAILGFSVHDTIVVFDRVREHLRINKERGVRNESFEHTVGKSISETYGRSINTSLTIFVVLVVLYIYGPISTQNFTFTLIAGIIAGTYSSICIAAPFLVTLEKLQNKS